MVVARGLTVTLVPVTVPTPWSIFRLVAPLTTQERVLLCPVVMVVGFAVKLDRTGFGCVTVTVTVAVEPPEALMAVRV